MHNACGTPKVRTPLSNQQLVQKAATLAEKRIGGTGMVAGTRKHTYAEKLLTRYQKIYGNRGLDIETMWVNGVKQKKRNVKGAARIDVIDTQNNIAYDFKFTIYPGKGLKQ